MWSTLDRAAASCSTSLLLSSPEVRQLPLSMDNTPTPTLAPGSGGLVDREELRALRELLPAHVQLGTVGWQQPAWAGIVWEHRRTPLELERDGLVEYGAHPLFTTVALEPGVESALSERDARRIASQLPGGMVCPVLVHPEITTPRFTRHDVVHTDERHLGGQSNPHFLDPAFFLREALTPLRTHLAAHLGPVLLIFPPQLQRGGLAPELFIERLERFCAHLPESVSVAIELREPAYLQLDYARLLAAHGLAHVFTSWPGMPSLLEQARAVPTPHLAIVHLTGPERPETARAPREADEGLYRQVVQLVAALPRVPTYILASDAAEGCAPLTLVGVARALVAARRT